MSRLAVNGTTGWRSLEEPAPLLALMAARLYPTHPPDPVVVASVAFQTVTKHLVALSSDPGARLPTFDEVRWRSTSGGIELRSAASGPGPGSTTARVELLVRRAFAPWVAVVRDHLRIGQRLLWANATASVLYATTQHRPPPGLADRTSVASALSAHVPGGLLATLHPVGEAPAFRRQACCLIDRAPGHRPCDECPLRLPRAQPRASTGRARGLTPAG